MVKVYRVFTVGFHQVLRDGMLLLLIPAPFFMGAALFALLPLVGVFLNQQYGLSTTLWYPLSDALLASMAPVMTALICAFVILDERDEGTGLYYRITPSGRHSYLLARIGLPMLWAYLSTVLVLIFFTHSMDRLPVILLAGLVGVLQGIVSCMLLVALANNKVEGLALAKLTNLLVLGFLFPWFISSPFRYLFGFMPSFWIGQLIYLSGQPFVSLLTQGIMGIVSALVWIRFLYGVFLRRLY